MKIHQLFLKDVSRPIDGVIKADDNRHLDLEVEEFVVTREVGRALDQFVERYLEDTSANGVWISGFFGSGKVVGISNREETLSSSFISSFFL
jgi:hypothetical protein